MESTYATAQFAQSFFGVALLTRQRSSSPHLKAQQFRQGTVIYGAEETIEHVYFPHTGVVSFVVGLTSGQFVEAGMLGRNSVVGSAAPLDGAIALNRAVVQVESMGVTAETAVLSSL